MNRDDIIRMAREAGAMPVVELAGCWITYNEPLQRFAVLVAAAEREACAKVCDELAARDKLSNYYGVAANAIRARGNQ